MLQYNFVLRKVWLKVVQSWTTSQQHWVTFHRLKMPMFFCKFSNKNIQA